MKTEKNIHRDESIQASRYAGYFDKLLIALFWITPLLYWSNLPEPSLNLRVVFFGLVVAFSLTSLLISQGKINPILYVNLLPKEFILGLALLLWGLVCCFNSFNFWDAFSQWMFLVIFATLTLLLASWHPNEFDFKTRMPFIASVTAIIFMVIFFCQILPELISTINHHKLLLVRFELGGTAGNKNFLAEVLTLNLFFILPGLTSSENLFKKYLIVTALFSVLTILYLNSFSVIIALVIGSIYFFAYKGGHLIKNYYIFKWCVIVLLLMIVIIGTTNKIVQNKFKEFTDSAWHHPDINATDPLNNNSVFERRLMWWNSIQLINEHPICGSGLNNWKIEQAKFGIGGNPYLNTGLERFEHPHNEYLSIASEIGLIGFFVFLILIVFILRWKHRHDGLISIIQFNASKAAIIAMLILCFFSYPIHRELTMMMASVHIAILIKGREVSSKLILNKHFSLSIGLVLILMTILIYIIRLKSDYCMGQGIAAQLHRKLDKAQENYREANTVLYPVDDKGTPLEWLYGNELFRSGDLQGACVQLEAGRHKNPYHSRLLNDLGTVYDQRGLSDSAISCYSLALKYCPGMIETKFNLTAALYNSGKLFDAYYSLSSINLPEKVDYLTKARYKQFCKVILIDIVKSDTALYENLQLKIKQQSKVDDFVMGCFKRGESPGDLINSIKGKTAQ